MVFVTLSSSWSLITTCVSHFARHCRRVSESASTWLPCPFCTTTQFGQLKPEVIARRDREDAEGSRQWLRMGFARRTRRSIESILADLDPFDLVINDTNTADFRIISTCFHCNFRDPCARRWRSNFLGRTVGTLYWAFWKNCIPMMTMSDHSILLLPVGKLRLV